MIVYNVQMSTPNKIRQLEQRRERLIGELLKTQVMIRGSFSTVRRKCGGSNCWCAQGGGHPVDRISYSDDGRSRTKAIKPGDVSWAREMTENYKRFRKNRQALRLLEKQINQAIDDLETRVVDKTARRRNYVT